MNNPMSLYKTYKSGEESIKVQLWNLGHTTKDAGDIIESRKQEYISIIKGEIERLEKEKIRMKEHHLCRFNDGLQNCDCYIEALSDQISHLQSELKAIEEDK